MAIAVHFFDDFTVYPLAYERYRSPLTIEKLYLPIIFRPMNIESLLLMFPTLFPVRGVYVVGSIDHFIHCPSITIKIFKRNA